MTQNPFDEGPGAGFGGGFDLGAMMEQAQQMQQQLMAAQQELSEATVTGTSGGVAVTLNGTGELTAVAFAPGSVDAVDTADPESLTDLGDLVVAAYRDAKAKADALASEKLGPLAGGMGLGLPGV